MSSSELNHSQMYSLFAGGPFENPSRAPVCQQHDYKVIQKECTCRWHGSVRLSWSRGGKAQSRFFFFFPVHRWTTDVMPPARHDWPHTASVSVRYNPKSSTKPIINNTFPGVPDGAGVHVVGSHFSYISIPLELKLFTGLSCNSFKRITSCLYRYGF